jgi:hypothetical protein
MELYDVTFERLVDHEVPIELVERFSELLSDSKLNATESPKLFATVKKSRDIIVLLLE